MSGNERWFPSHLKELREPECLELLAQHEVGRVAYCDDLGPVVLPVNYALDQGTILIQVSPHSTLANHLRDTPASFQIDEFDDYTQTAGACWSEASPRTSIHLTSRPTMIGPTRGLKGSEHSMSASRPRISLDAASYPHELDLQRAIGDARASSSRARRWCGARAVGCTRL